MVDNVVTGDLKKQLTVWLNHILEGIKEHLIESEQELENKIRIISDSDRAKAQFNTGATLYPTLLELLGYTQETCDDHPIVMVVMAGHKPVKVIPDYIVKDSDQKDLAVWELKAPGEDVEGQEPTEQLMSYCNEAKRKTALGILFNGKKLRLFINPNYPGLGKELLRSSESGSFVVD